ncbi:hypothetical protein LAZ67_5002122 [Cordylochernes scorpioides]|uniref:Uncharacterized protein n=1 Tax=Cordylochernes scorpioides TaxID=51811 RepID=A0ABY6KG57_9ARAC|nr:hypothetical protein LAZ67_5002122 [Cordylochernes scorpioides]
MTRDSEDIATCRSREPSTGPSESMTCGDETNHQWDVKIPDLLLLLEKDDKRQSGEPSTGPSESMTCDDETNHQWDGKIPDLLLLLEKDDKRHNQKDDPHETWPKIATTPETIEKGHNIMLDDRQVKACEIAEDVGMSEERERNILHEELGMRRLWASTIGSAIPHYSPDLAPSDFHFFPHLKKFVFEKHFGSNEEVERAVDEYFNGLSDSHFWEGILILETHWTECVEVKGDYVEK